MNEQVPGYFPVASFFCRVIATMQEGILVVESMVLVAILVVLGVVCAYRSDGKLLLLLIFTAPTQGPP